MIELLVILLRPALMCVDGKSLHPLHILAAVIAFLLDVIIARTSWVLIAGWPKANEITISHTLERLCVTPGPDQKWFIELARKINRASPTGDHIKSVLTIKENG